MSIELRLPNISGSEKEQLIQIRSYLYQLIPQLEFALNAVQSPEVSNAAVEQIAKKIGATVVASTTPSSVSANVAFENIKQLIIDSAEIVKAYYPKIVEELNGAYFAESSFGTFVEETKKITEKTTQYTNEKFESTQTMVTELTVSVNGQIGETNAAVEVIGSKAEDLSKSVDETNKAIGDTNAKVDATTGEVEDLKKAAKDTTDKVNDLDSAIENTKKDIDALNILIVESRGYIRSGELYKQNGIPVYGVEVGQTNEVNGEEIFNKYARFTADKLSFYDQRGYEVAYISDEKLYIDNAEIKKTLKMGGFLIDTTKGLTLKWAGRG